ncbi:HNH endonuclease [Acinetobacter sp. ANC 4648]|uniref:HNH endonuclease n=1 Tax=Acinetobacter sp. ANC 4648 TaxID=1977875 RepID=UPI000A33D7E9|nr:HNH endonuclease [Acinetobacter sp. ANC 4648]OTG82177.1 hypothetical protein B9T27_07950 [Acinetobacter sp. ANC 4648]
MNNTTLHCIYVADPSQNNFLTGLNNGIWGLKKLNANSGEFKIGDYLIFAHKILGKVRQSFNGQLNQYVLAKITSNTYSVTEKQDELNPKVWDDEIDKNLYLFRFNFEILNSYPALKIKSGSYQLNNGSFTAGDDIESIRVYEALRYSSCVQGTNGSIDSVTLKIDENQITDALLKKPSEIFNLSDAIFIRSSDSPKFFEKFKPDSQVTLLEQEAESEVVDDIDNIQQSRILDETEKTQLVLSRIGQGQFRKDLLKNFKETCLLTGIKHVSLLVASHIKPWKDCDNKERLDAKNGLLLSSLMDRLFDRYFITFDPETLRLITCHDPLISKIIVNHQLVDFIIKVPYKGKNLTTFKNYLNCHFTKFKEINEKRYGK